MTKVNWNQLSLPLKLDDIAHGRASELGLGKSFFSANMYGIFALIGSFCY